MLSGETANGAYPVEAVKTMAKIARTVEDSEEYKAKMRAINPESRVNGDVSRSVACGAYRTATEIGAAALVAPTMSGTTARLLSNYRPEQPIIAATPNDVIQRQLLLNWGIFPVLVPVAEDSESMIQNCLRAALDTGYLKSSDKVVSYNFV